MNENSWASQDCTRPAIASDFFQKSLAQGLDKKSAPCGALFVIAFGSRLQGETEASEEVYI